MTDPEAAPVLLVRPAQGVHVIRAADAVLAESASALESRLAGDEAAMIWLPMAEAGEPFLDPTPATFELPGLGHARLLDVVGADAVLSGAAWVMERPAPGAEALKDHVSFDPDQVTIERL